LEEVCHKIGDGLHGTPKYDEDGGVAFINGNNLIDGKIVITDRTLFVNDIEAQKYRIDMDANTILLSINGTLGRTAIFRNENVILGKSACYCNINNTFLITKFVEHLMNSLSFKGFLEDNSSKSTIKNVGLKAIRGYGIILPPLTLQKQFAEKIEKIEQQKKLISQSIKEVEDLFNSRMSYYFD
jgi:type I restriction enzyme S subunit